ncbi:MAG: hypothetical protein AAGU21_00280 [Solidesulfovibrio sp.]|uniref:hypothetical protein n=1 Tax=Solidesulfovibrio sp. TaxID=2910990 RepID=UPI003158BA35
MYSTFNNKQQGGYVIINGRRVPVSGGVRGSDLAREAGGGPGRRVVKLAKGLGVENIDPSRYYAEHELRGKDGGPVKITSMPDRTKGGLFDGRRSALSREVITEQVYDLALKFAKGSGVDFDEDSANWVIFPRYIMPRIWGVGTAPLMILFPTDYPLIAPIGFYLPGTIQSPHGHFFRQAYHDASNAPIMKGWNWYCCFLHPGAWRPAPNRQAGDWRKGDNLWTYITLVSEVLNGQAA